MNGKNIGRLFLLLFLILALSACDSETAPEDPAKESATKETAAPESETETSGETTGEESRKPAQSPEKITIEVDYGYDYLQTLYPAYFTQDEGQEYHIVGYAMAPSAYKYRLVYGDLSKVSMSDLYRMDTKYPAFTPQEIAYILDINEVPNLQVTIHFWENPLSSYATLDADAEKKAMKYQLGNLYFVGEDFHPLIEESVDMTRSALPLVATDGTLTADVEAVLSAYFSGIYGYLKNPNREDGDSAKAMEKNQWIYQTCVNPEAMYWQLRTLYSEAESLYFDRGSDFDRIAELRIYAVDEKEIYLSVKSEIFGRQWMILEPTTKYDTYRYKVVGTTYKAWKNYASVQFNANQIVDAFLERFPGAFSFGDAEYEIAEEAFWTYLTEDSDWNVQIPKEKLKTAFTFAAATDRMQFLAADKYQTGNQNAIAFFTVLHPHLEELGFTAWEMTLLQKIDASVNQGFRKTAWIAVQVGDSEYWQIKNVTTQLYQ